ncbi:MAG: esterase [Flavobacteriaceae bacterium]|nr:esterase [Bacteroidia bacterium]NNK88732.1 esterase [Flavobacteriaceae bacterium]
MKAKHLKFILLIQLSISLSFGQTIYENFDSYKLGDTREIKIQLPRNYDKNKEKTYPLFVVFDGDYLFEIVSGNVDYFSYWEDMPEVLVVGINQVDTRDRDNYYSEQNSLPIEDGADFFEFIGMELLPFMESNYRVADFRVAVGHGESANFINYYLLKDKPIFQGFINMSPLLAPDMLDYIPERASQVQSKTFYYVATSDQDLKPVKEDASALNASLAELNNESFIYTFDNFEGPTHYSNPAYALPRALESIFYVFQPISKTEFTERILPLKSSPVTYLLEKYQIIKERFGLDKQILINDIKAIEAAIEKNKSFEYYEELGKIARKQYPDTLLGNYYLARFYEETGEPKKAMRTYRSAYILEEIGGITKDLMLEKADAIKADFGY